MTAHRNTRWLVFFAASLLAHAAVLAWVELSSGGVSGVSTTIRVMLASAGSDAGAERAAPRTWHPASATRNRDLFRRAAAPPPEASPATARDVAAKVKDTVVAAKEVASETPPPRKPAAKKTAAAPRAPSPGDAQHDETPAIPESAANSSAVAATPPNHGAPASAGAGHDAPAASAASPAAPAGAAAGNDGELLALLHQAIDRGKRYPSLARRQQREGTATVRFRLSPNGEMDAIDIDRSSGFRVLDTAAISAVSSVAPFAPARTLLSEMTRFKVDVTFRLN